jgi:TetR/AcrR family acrAB operon transcriptional repressor
MEVFAQTGYRRASMDQVAEAAGLTRQAVYHYFRSKAELFRASVETLHEGANEAETEAGRKAEEAGEGLAAILAAQIDARFRYLVECLEETSQPEELLSERQSQTRDLIQSFVEQNRKLHAATIERVGRAQGLKLREGMSATDLARAIEIATSGFDDLRFKASFLDDLSRVVSLIVTGAVTQPAASPGKSKKISARKASSNRK